MGRISSMSSGDIESTITKLRKELKRRKKATAAPKVTVRGKNPWVKLEEPTYVYEYWPSSMGYDGSYLSGYLGLVGLMDSCLKVSDKVTAYKSSDNQALVCGHLNLSHNYHAKQAIPHNKTGVAAFKRVYKKSLRDNGDVMISFVKSSKDNLEVSMNDAHHNESILITAVNQTTPL